ncbi:Wzz/FepE/Etk N-terminal domain-containing protein [Pseudomonas sp. BJa3]|uniref:Wzz/FepE/Etk N-terminal domain-containing protein n=1 Tax=Pseudomonas sp. BJa3 TaxID=2986525 RepID=UPI00226598A5|nr:Wzz/FepE/Etk N-terminal domain-containing protein [Pseudomonas sp. BJa3]MCX5509224.1 Wzz/FepE/Etk N-terminal domain-containing protein [Pseudomonas sp. BJa3]
MESLGGVSLSRRVEFDLFIIAQTIWRQRLLVATVALVFTAMCVVYAYFLATPVYQVKNILRPASQSSLDALKRTGLYDVSPVSALLRFGAALESYDIRKKFYEQHQDLFSPYKRAGLTDEQVLRMFNTEMLKVVMPVAERDFGQGRLQITMTYPEGVDGVRMLNDYVAFVVKGEEEAVRHDVESTRRSRVEGLASQIDSLQMVYEHEKSAQIAKLREQNILRRAVLQDELGALRVELKTQRANRLHELEEAIAVARSLGLKRPTTASLLGESGMAAGGNVIRTEISSQKEPLYFLGTDVLEAEQAVLRKRDSDDFTNRRVAEIQKELQMLSVDRQIEVLQRRKEDALFVAGTSAKRTEQALLGAQDSTLAGLRLVEVEQPALAPSEPIKPMRLILISFGALLGVIVGAIMAVLRRYAALRNVPFTSDRPKIVEASIQALKAVD